MREKWQKQMPLMPQIKEHAQAKELKVISDIIDAHPIICDHVLRDLNRGKLVAYRIGADGMSADQVLRCAIVKILFGFTYEDLAFHIVDSQALSWFCRIGIADKGYKKSALNKNIKTIADTTWELINTDLLGYAKQEGIEKGRQVRVDCTCVETHIHHPTDSNLLWDGVRVLTRLVDRCRQDFRITVPDFHNHTRFAKKRGLSETDMCRSHYVYRRLRRFRAGIESGISWLKRCLGLTRCTWKGWDSFRSYVWSSIVAANLLTIARAKTAT